MDIDTFLKLDRQEISDLVKQRGKPRCVAIMLDGTRRVLKLEPKYHEDSWLYYKDHIKNLIYKSIETVDILFDMGVDVVVGPLASLGNLHRKNFMPKGLKRLIDPLLDNYPMQVYQKHNASLSLYGDLEYTMQMPGGKILKRYINEFKRIEPDKPNKHILVGVGFATDRETQIIAHKAIDYFKKSKRKPAFKQMIIDHFGFDIPPIDIFIRTNEVRISGGLSPLLISQGTQFYFPVAPGILSFSENLIKRVFYDYLFNRVISEGKHEHIPVSSKDSQVVKNFYFRNKKKVLGIGVRVADMWIHPLDTDD